MRDVQLVLDRLSVCCRSRTGGEGDDCGDRLNGVARLTRVLEYWSATIATLNDLR